MRIHANAALPQTQRRLVRELAGQGVCDTELARRFVSTGVRLNAGVSGTNQLIARVLPSDTDAKWSLTSTSVR